MRKFYKISISLILTAIFAVTAFAQVQTGNPVAVVDTQEFYRKQGGVTKIGTAYDKLEVEFKSKFAALDAKVTKLETLAKDIQTAKDSLSKGVKIDEKAADAKLAEAQQLQIQYKREQEDVKNLYQQREGTVMEPILTDILKSLEVYAKQKGFLIVLNAGKMQETGMLLFKKDSSDITKEFIAYYNARPAGSAMISKPE